MYASKSLGQALSLGYLMIGIASFELSQQEKEQLLHPAIAGVVLS